MRTPSGLIGIEAKCRAEVHESDTRALRSVAAAAGVEWRGGLGVHAGNRLHRPSPEGDVWAMPVYRLL